jgi:DNA-binding MarR family transcriptional regulator
MDYIGKYVWQICKFGQMYVERRLSCHGIGSGQHRILIGLYHKDGMSQEEISAFMETDKAATARALNRLEAQGYVRRTEDKNDRRKKIVLLTEKALAIQDELISVLDDWENILFLEFASGDREKIRSALFQIAANAASGIGSREKFIP